MLNVHQLELFYYVAKHGGIMPAIRKMPYGIQQPAVSGQILQLEAKIGTRLFQRRPFILTPAGRQIFDFVSPFFGGLPELEDRLATTNRPQLRLGASNNVLRDQLSELLRDARAAWPTLQFSLRETSQSSAEQMLRDGELDLAVLTRQSSPGPGVRSQELLQLPLILLVPQGERRATAKSLFAESSTRPLIAMPPTEQVTRIFQRQLAKLRMTWDIGIEANSLDVVHSCALEGFGIGLSLDIPGKTIPKGLRRIPLTDFPRVEIIALWKGRPEGPAEYFLKRVQQQAKKLQASL